jgi:hypothetical protein
LVFKLTDQVFIANNTFFSSNVNFELLEYGFNSLSSSTC